MGQVYHKNLVGDSLHQPFKIGKDIDKAGSPQVGDWYFATDTEIMYRCLTLGLWSNYLNKLGKDPDYIDISEKGVMTMKGDARYVDLKAFTSMDLFPTHHAFLEITALADPGYISSTLATSPDANRFLDIQTINTGLHVKGRQAGGYTQGDTTSVGKVSIITITTKNASWTQNDCWTLVIDIDSGNVTGHFTIYCPAFNLLSYDSIQFYITDDGATYYSKDVHGFDDFVCGSKAADELTTNNLTAGIDVACTVSGTTGFHVGNKTFISDSENSEWVRIKSIVTDTSITVDSLSNNYTIVNGAKVELIDTTRTAHLTTVQRNIGKMFRMPPGINCGVSFQLGIPHYVDKTEPIKLAFQYIARTANPTEQVVKMRIQYICGKYTEAMPESNQYGVLRYTTFIPASTVDINNVAALPEIPVSDWVDAGMAKRANLIQVVRLGKDTEDTYEGDIDIVAVVYLMKSEKLGGAEALFA